MIPTIRTSRLLLRGFVAEDAEQTRSLAGDREVAATTSNIPHPYEEGMAEEWIATHEPEFAAGESVVFAVTEAAVGQLVGAVGLILNTTHRHGELGYWIARRWWSMGYATEAAEAVVEYGFTQLELHRIFASHFSENVGSGRVMQKLGMTYEGTLREHLTRWGAYKDAVHYGILVHEWRQRTRPQ